MAWLRPSRALFLDQIQDLPSVALVITAYNEAECIGSRLANAFQTDYPPERFSVVVLSDASTDETDAIVGNWPQVALFRAPTRVGKSAALNALLPNIASEIIVFSDANSMYRPDAIRKLASHFHDESVGYVVGVQKYVSGHLPAEASESLYWDRELSLKQLEASVSSVVGGDGAIYALRRSLFVPLHPNDVSDLRLPLEAVKRGYRGVFEPQAQCVERATSTFAGQYQRKVRIIHRSIRTLLRVPATLNPFRVGIFSYQLFAHKVLRWFSPIFLIGLIVSIITLAARGIPFFQGFALLGIIFLLVGLLYHVPTFRRFKIVYLPYYLIVMNTAALVALWSFAFGKDFATWVPDRS